MLALMSCQLIRLWRAAPGIFLFTAATLLSGCALFSDDDTPRAEMIAVPEMTQTLSETKVSGKVSDQWPTLDWWKTFENPSLNRLIETTLTANHDLKAAAARLRQAQAMVDVRAAELYPTVDANVSFSAQRYSANSTQARFAGEHFRQLLVNPLVLRYHLDFWGRDKAALAASVGAALADDAELADTRLMLAAAVARGYFDLLSATEKLRLAEQIVADRRSLLDIATVRLKTGLVANAPIFQAQVDLNAALQTEAEVRAEINLLRDLLATLSGNGPDWGRDLNVDRGALPERIPLPGDLPLRLLSRRPDVTAARLRVEAAAQEIKVAETAFYPDVNLIAFTGLHSVSITDVLLQGSSLAYAVGPSIDFPIFEGGRLRANLSHQEAAYDAAVESYNGSLLQAVQEVADALAKWDAIDKTYNTQRQTISAVVENRQLAVSLNRSGLNDSSDVVSAQVAEYEQRYRLAALESQYLTSTVNLFTALGGGYANAKTSLTTDNVQKDPS